MSLIAWFPLNGNLNNQGTNSDITLSNSGATSVSGGKVTRYCYSFDGSSNHMLSALPTFTPFAPISISLWYSLSSYNGYSPILGFGVADCVHGLWLRHGSGASNLRIEYGDGTTNYDKDTGATSSLNTWYNLVVVYNGENIKVYRDGAELVSYSAPASGIATNSMLQLATFWAGKANCKLNDVRVYDHALSKKEIHDLALGLCLHYKFDFEDMYIPVEYLESVGNQYVNTGVCWEDGSDLTYEITLQFTASGEQTGTGHHRCVVGQNSSGNLVLAGVTTTITGSEKHTCKVIWPAGSTSSSLTIQCYVDDVSVGSRSVEPYDTRPYLLHACVGWSTDNGLPPYTCDSVKIYECKFYRGGKLINHFIPCVNKMYATGNSIGYYDLVNKTFHGWEVKNTSGTIRSLKYKEYEVVSGSSTYLVDKTVTDSSGYGHNGEISNALSMPTLDTNIGTAALYVYLLGDSGKNLSTSLNPSYITNGTVCFWYKKSNDGNVMSINGGHFIAATGQAGAGWLAATANPTPFNSGASYTTFYIDGVSGADGANSYITDTDWHFYAYTGVNMSTWTEFNLHKHGDNSWCYTGGISDYRVYTTSLSADEIQHLYHNRASLDNEGNLYCANITEVNTTVSLPTSGSVVQTTCLEEDSDLYTELEYIECTGSQYIDTGYCFNDSSKYPLAVDFSCSTGAGGSNNPFGGCGNDSWAEPIMLNFCGGKLEWGTGEYYNNGPYNTDQKYDYYFYSANNSQYWSQDGVVISRRTHAAVYDTKNFNIGMMNNTYFYGKIYRCALYSGSTGCVRDFIPVKLNSTGVVGLYDKRYGKFYPPTAGTFVAGPVKGTTAKIIGKNIKKIPYFQDSYRSSYFDSGIKLDPNSNYRLEEDIAYLTIDNIYSGVNGYMQHTPLSVDATLEKRHLIINDYRNHVQYIYRDGNHVSTQDWTSYSNPGQSILILAMSNGSGLFSSTYQMARIYGVRIYENDILVRNYIPAIYGPNDERGLFETLNGTFLSGGGAPLSNTEMRSDLNVIKTNQLYEGV